MKNGTAFFIRTTTACMGLFVVCVPASRAQQQQDREPRLGYVFPAGGKRGATCEVIVGGRMVGGTKEVLVSGSGVQAKVVGFSRPLPPKRFNELRDYLQEARKKAMESGQRPMLRRFDVAERVSIMLKESGATDEEIRQFIRQRDERNDPKRQQNPQLVETVTLQLAVAADAQTGPRELRLLTPTGVSNPLVFCVGKLSEMTEGGPEPEEKKSAPQVKLPAVLNGQILPGEADHYTFQAQRGDRVVVAVQARDLIPYLADAVPGWFQPVVTLRDAKHQEVAYSDDYRFSPDPAFCYDVKEGGTFDLEIRDALYRGREDFVYRITVGAVPFVTGIFPLGGKAGAPALVNVTGVNLGRGAFRKITLPGDEGIHRVPELANGFATADVSFAGDVLPECSEREPNNEPAKAQKVALPVIINGRIDTVDDTDLFTFACKAGEQVVVEVTARRLNSPLDSWLKITDANGKQVAFNDDSEDRGSGLLTHYADSRLAFTATTAGPCCARIGDAQHKGGPDFSYRLRISAPRPDFALRATPSGINARAGGRVPVTFYALRKDGFAGDIALALKDAPAGFSLEGGVIPAGADKIRATLACPPMPAEEPVSLAIEGTASISGSSATVHAVVPADDMQQAFIYHHLVPAKRMLVTVTGGKNGRPPLRIAGGQAVKIPAGGAARAVVSAGGRVPFLLSEARPELVDPPDGISIEGISVAEGGAAVSFHADAAKVKAGTRGNLLVEIFLERAPPAKDGKPGMKRKWSAGYLPAIPFEIVKK
jgi:hypothetical protein